MCQSKCAINILCYFSHVYYLNKVTKWIGSISYDVQWLCKMLEVAFLPKSFEIHSFKRKGKSQVATKIIRTITYIAPVSLKIKRRGTFVQ